MTQINKNTEKTRIPLSEQSYIENILRLNKGKVATIYTSLKQKRVFKGIVEEVGSDHVILNDSDTGTHILLLSSFINFITFNEEISYDHQTNGANENLNTRVQPSLSARSAILLNGNNGNILYESNAFEQLPIASLTKIMTAVVALESANLDDTIVISETAASQPPSSCPLTAGDTFTLRDLLYCLLLRSGNDAAWAIAEHVAGSVPAFVNLMNQKASALDLNQTNFTNPSGLDDPSSNISTSYDIARLMQYAMTNPDFRTISGTKTYQTTSGFGIEYTYIHKHRLLNNIDYVTAGKTGFTSAAGRTLVTTGAIRNQQLIVVTLNDVNDWEDHINLFEYGFNLLGLRVKTPRVFLKSKKGYD